MNVQVACVLAAGAVLAAPSFASDEIAGGEVDQLRGEVASLRAEIAELRRDDADWLTEQRADQIRSLVGDVLADADTRASLLQGGMTSGYDGGFSIGSSDGNFAMKINGQIQTRFIYDNQDNSAEGDDNRWGFEQRRVKVKFKGHVVDPSWQYAINGAFDTDDTQGTFELEEAEIKKKLDNGWYVRFGQFKGPFLREELTSSSRQLTVERSLVNEAFNQDRSEGVEIGYETDSFRVAGMYGNGFASRNRSWNTEDTEFAIMGRAELLLSGNWKQFKDFTSWSGDEQGVMIGLGAAYDKDEFGSATPGEAETFRWTVDASAEFGGGNLFGYFTGRHTDSTLDTDEYGAVIQGGYFLVEDEWEGFIRYEWGDDDSSSDDLSVLTLGVNRYYNRHGLKWTTDVGWGINEVTSSWDTNGAGWREDGTNEDGQFVLRSQFQLLF